MGSWNQFKLDPFSYVDSINLKLRGYEFNIFKDDAGCRKVALGFGGAMLALWILLGFDSTPLQFVHVLYDGVPGLMAGSKSLGDLLVIYNNFYGKEMHYSAFVIYVFLFWGLSRNWANIGITKTRNVIYSFAAVFLAIGVFEWYWIFSFGIFQQQPWVYTWNWPQMRILYQNFGLTLAGCLAAFYMWVMSYQFKDRVFVKRLYFFSWRSWKLWALVGASIAAAVFWIYYPGPVQQFSVMFSNGQLWHSSRLFPQTLYTVDTTPLDSVNAGVWFYFQNNWIHAVNTIVKFLWAFTAYQFFKVRSNLNE